MPVTVDQLRSNNRKGPVVFQRNRTALYTFSRYLYNLARSMKTGKTRRLGVELDKYSQALQDVASDPNVPGNRAQIDAALDTLANFGNFLSSASSLDNGANNVCETLIDGSDERETAFRDGLNAVNAYCEFGLNVNSIIDGEIDNPTEEERNARQQRLEDWKQQRTRERETNLARERRIAEAQERNRINAQLRSREADRLAEEERQREQQRLEQQRQQRLEQQRQQEEERIRQQEEQRLSEEQRQQRERDARRAEEERQRAQRLSLENFRDQALSAARNPNTSANDKKTCLAQTVAYQRELDRVQGGVRPVNINNVNNDIQGILDGAAIQIAERRGNLDTLALMTPHNLNNHILSMEQEVGRYQGGSEAAPARAQNILGQLNRTWRVRSDSAEYRAMKETVQSMAGLQRTTQTENYLAAENVTRYIEKNLNRAKSDVGMTRMACSLAFLKQIMSPAQFKAYCINLNTRRHIPSRINANSIEYEKSNPRAIIPEEIGTIAEVYHDARERISDCARRGEKPSARDLAMITALKTLERKNQGRGGDAVVVEHEALQEEIEKVMRDPRFINAYQNRPDDELCELGFGGNINTIEGYAAPLRPDQQERIDNGRVLRDQAEREAKRNQLNERRQAWEAFEGQEAERRRQRDREREEQRRQEQERQRQEQERIRAEREEAVYLSKHKGAMQIIKDLIPDALKLKELNISGPVDENYAQKKLGGIFGILEGKEEPEIEAPKNVDSKKELNEVFDLLNDKKEPKKSDKLVQDIFDEVMDGKKNADKSTEEILASLIAVQEFQRREKIHEKYEDKMLNTAKLEKRINVLKNDPVVKDMAKDPKTVKLIKEAFQEGEKQKKFDKDLYSVTYLCNVLNRQYKDEAARRERLANLKIRNGYEDRKPLTDALFRLDRRLNYKKVGAFAAEMTALHEFEKQGGGPDAHLDYEAFKKRVEELKKDPAFEKIGQTLMGLTLQRKMQQTVVMEENREQAFAKMVNDMYREEVAKREKVQDEPKNDVPHL